MDSTVTFYHYTRSKNIESILSSGLLVNTGDLGIAPDEGLRSYEERFGMQPVFLAHGRRGRRLVEFMIPTEWWDEFTWLEIDCSGIDVEPEIDYRKIYKDPKDYPKFHLTFISRKSIEPNRIRVWKNTTTISRSVA